MGNSGAGKSTLARALAERFGSFHLDLDTVVFERAPFPKVELARVEELWGFLRSQGRA